MTMTLDGSNGVTFNDTSLQGAAASPYVLKNRLINGDFRIDQRNAGASVTATGVAFYTLDRWYTNFSQNSKYTIQQNAGSVTPPVGFSNYLGATSSSAYSIAAGDYFFIEQLIEGFNFSDLNFGTANAKTVTLSFQVYSSLTGTFGGALVNSGQSRSYPFTYSIPTANTWTSISITIAGDTTGTWIGATNGIGCRVRISLGAGSSFSSTAGSWATQNSVSATGATSVVGTNGATFYITGVQLEIGSSATPFERRLYNQELAACQRYYQQYDASESAAAGAGIVGVCGSSSAGVMSGLLPVAMRTTATVAFNNLVLNYGGATVGVSSITTYSAQKAVGMDITASSSPMTTGRACVLQFSGGQSAANKITFSAEL
jgi:hypothetical protein